jgi:hypothetical protein
MTAFAVALKLAKVELSSSLTPSFGDRRTDTTTSKQDQKQGNEWQ